MDTSEENGEKEHNAEFLETIGDRVARKQHAQNLNRSRSLWHGLGTIGTVGWTIGLPTVLGVLLGVWIDSIWPASPFSWTLVLLIGGLLTGLASAWLWLEGQRQEIGRGLFKPEESENDDQ
jgi:ATP synthase protein I